MPQLLSDSEPAVRYWGAIGVLVRLADTAGFEGTQPTEQASLLYQHWKPALETLLKGNNK